MSIGQHDLRARAESFPADDRIASDAAYGDGADVEADDFVDALRIGMTSVRVADAYSGEFNMRATTQKPSFQTLLLSLRHTGESMPAVRVVVQGVAWRQ